jgi:hypothetical protein
VIRGGESLPRLEELPREAAADVLHIATYRLPIGDIVIEAYDQHRLIAARTVVSHATGSCEEAVDVALAATHLERCGAFCVEPLGKRQRLNAQVGLRASRHDGALQAERRLHDADLAGRAL